MNILDRFKLKLAKYNKSTCKTSDGITHIFFKNREKAGKLDKDGCKTGLWITTIPDRIIESATYLDGKLNGPYSSSWREEVQIIHSTSRKMIVETSGAFANGVKEGMWTEGNASGHYTNGLRTGLWKVPGRLNELITGHYSGGLKTGIWEGENSKYVFKDDIITEAQWRHPDGDMHKSKYQNGIMTNEQVFDHTGFMFCEKDDGKEVFYWKEWIERTDSKREGYYTFQRHDGSEFFEIHRKISRGYETVSDFVTPKDMMDYTITDGHTNYPSQVAKKYASIFESGSYMVRKNPELESEQEKPTVRITQSVIYFHYTINGLSVFWDRNEKVFKDGPSSFGWSRLKTSI